MLRWIRCKSMMLESPSLKITCSMSNIKSTSVCLLCKTLNGRVARVALTLGDSRPEQATYNTRSKRSVPRRTSFVTLPLTPPEDLSIAEDAAAASPWAPVPTIRTGRGIWRSWSPPWRLFVEIPWTAVSRWRVGPTSDCRPCPFSMLYRAVKNDEKTKERM